MLVVPRSRRQPHGEHCWGPFVAWCLLLALWAHVAIAQTDDWPQPPPERLPQAAVPISEVGTIYDWHARADTPLGVGRFGPATQRSWADWVSGLTLPLYASPEGEQVGWLANGWFLGKAAGLDFRLDTSMMVETGYEALSYIVLEHTEGGWFKLAYARANERNQGTAWAQVNRLAHTSEAMVVESWAYVLLDQKRLFYRSEVPHALRKAPADSGARVSWIRAHHEIEPLAIQGDWMFVRISDPPNWCADEGGVRGTFVDGWVKWRGPKKGPWLWYYTRGC